MKTMRTLTLERFPMDTPEEEIPRQMLMLDNQVALYASMVPPGDHYFYFVRDRGHMFLSPNYEVVRFKSTNVFLNRISVTKRLEDVETVHVAKDGEEEEPVFMKDRSVFRDYREDTHGFLRKAFEEDWQFGKIPRTVKKGQTHDEESARIKELLFEHYVRLINIFDYYSGCSSYPTISMNDFTSFANVTKILDHEFIGLAQLDLILVATCVSHHQYVNSAEKDLQRYEFLEMIVRTANFRYKDTRQVKTTCDAIEKLLNDHIYKYSKEMNGDKFRRYHCYTVKVNEILKKNEQNIMKLYLSFTHAKKRYVMMPEAQAFVRKVGLRISEMMVGALYAESMMTIIDTIRDQTKPNQMKYVEFLVFLCRITHEHYLGSPYEKELLYLKLDHLMPAFLAFVGAQPTFLFGEKFKVELQEEATKAKRRRKQLKKAIKRARDTGQPVDPKLVAEVKAYEENLSKTGMASFKASQMGNKAILDSDSDGDSSDDKFERATPQQKHYNQGKISSPNRQAAEANDLVQNADLAADMGPDGEMIGVIIPPPENLDETGNYKIENEVVQEVDDEDAVSDAEGDQEGNVGNGNGEAAAAEGAQ